MTLFDELKARGLVAQVTDEEKVKELINGTGQTFYIGFDPTADSLHVGHFVAMVVMAHMQRHGHRPIALFGGGTGMIGDPTGKTDMRKMLTKEEIQHNIECFVKQMSTLIDFNDNKAIMVNNGDWLLDLNYIDFLREVGVHFSVNRMLAAECYKQRMERGLTFFELNYMLMQSYDFYKLHKDYDCVMELGGDDQWSNIIGGVELCRRKLGHEVYGLTFNLLLKSDGKKMGKTEGGAVWLDPQKTSPYDFYQYWRNVDDADVINCLKMLTFVPLEEIAKYEQLSGSELNAVKALLAYELTKMIHGKEEADKADAAAKALFGAGQNTDDMPTTAIDGGKIAEGYGILDLMVECGLIPSKGEGRRLIAGGGVSLNDQKVADPLYKVTPADFSDGYAVIRKGKKVFHKVTLN